MTQTIVAPDTSNSDLSALGGPDGESLALEAMLAAGRRFDAVETALVLIELCRLLEASHRAGIIHRSLTPAKIRVRFEDAKARVSIIATAEADVLAPPYAAPEVLAGQEADARADLYSIGVIAHRMVT